MNLREQKKEKRREEILLAGLNLFVKKGYSAAKTSDIAKEANMSNGLLFHYFDSKEKLYEELIRIGMDSSNEWLEGNTNYPLAFFMTLTEKILDMIKENPYKAKFFILLAQALRSTATSQEIKKILGKQGERYTKTVMLIQKGQQMGEIRDGDPKALSYAFWCSVQGIVEQIAVYPKTPFPQAEWMVSILKK